MKPRASSRSEAALTLFEVGIVVAILVVLVAMFLPALGRVKRRSSRIYCINNLKQIGLAYRVWESDNRDVYPMGILVMNGGSMELVATGNVTQTFQMMSNELCTPRILICPGDGVSPGDTNRTYATNFSTLSNSNISYFVGVDVTNETNPKMILTGDSDLQVGGKTAEAGLLPLRTSDLVSWQPLWHAGNGNLGFADGSAQTVTAGGLHECLVQTGLATNRLALP